MDDRFLHKMEKQTVKNKHGTTCKLTVNLDMLISLWCTISLT